HVGQRPLRDGRERVREIALLEGVLDVDGLDAVGPGQNRFVAHGPGGPPPPAPRKSAGCCDTPFCPTATDPYPPASARPGACETGRHACQLLQRHSRAGETPPPPARRMTELPGGWKIASWVSSMMRRCRPHVAGGAATT